MQRGFAKSQEEKLLGSLIWRLESRILFALIFNPTKHPAGGFSGSTENRMGEFQGNSETASKRSLTRIFSCSLSAAANPRRSFPSVFFCLGRLLLFMLPFADKLMLTAVFTWHIILVYHTRWAPKEGRGGPFLTPLLQKLCSSGCGSPLWRHKEILGVFSTLRS